MIHLDTHVELRTAVAHIHRVQLVVYSAYFMTGSREGVAVGSPETGRCLRSLYLPPQSLSEKPPHGSQDGGGVSGQAAAAASETTENSESTFALIKRHPGTMKVVL